jgi:DNA polymerase-1
MKLLIDADFIVYKACAAAETEIDWGDDVILVTSKFSDAMRAATREISKIKGHFLWDVPSVILFFSDSTNFRKEILPDYKGHRNRKKPCGYKRVINALTQQYEVIIMPTLEADDSMGIYATKNPGNTICSPDKDMRQIPGNLYNLTDDFTLIEPNDGAKWHLIQSLSGDQTDGYAGCPTVGVKRATTLFESKGYSWKTVVETFKEKGLTEDDALINARLARILTVEDYDFTKRKPIPWTPKADYRIDNGAGSKTKVAI